MKYPDIIGKVANELELPEDVVNKTYKAYWLYIKDAILSLPLKLDINEKDFNNLRTNFNIPSLGKLTCTYDRMLGVKKRFEYIKNLRQKK